MDKIPLCLLKAIVLVANSCKSISSAASSLAYSSMRINKGTSSVTISIASGCSSSLTIAFSIAAPLFFSYGDSLSFPSRSALPGFLSAASIMPLIFSRFMFSCFFFACFVAIPYITFSASLPYCLTNERLFLTRPLRAISLLSSSFLVSLRSLSILSFYYVCSSKESNRVTDLIG